MRDEDKHEVCGWCSRPIVWTESFPLVAPPRWVHLWSRSEICYGAPSGARWAKPYREAEPYRPLDCAYERSVGRGLEEEDEYELVVRRLAGLID